MSNDQFRVRYTIERKQDLGGEFTEIGHGQGEAADSVDGAVFRAMQQIEAREWETSPWMPRPASI